MVFTASVLRDLVRVLRSNGVKHLVGGYYASVAGLARVFRPSVQLLRQYSVDLATSAQPDSVFGEVLSRYFTC